MNQFHIALICDDGYAMPTAVTIQSILDNTHSLNLNQIVIHVCTFGLSNLNTEKLSKLSTDSVCVCIDLFDEVLFKERLGRVNQKTHVTASALIKFELANYFCHLDRILYLDSDIIVKGDLDELFEMDITDVFLAASFEFWSHMNNLRFKVAGTINEEFYFNSGVMLMNLQKMRSEGIPDLLWDFKLNHTRTKLMDQECFNEVCGCAALPISCAWNFNPVFLNNYYIPEINAVYRVNYSSPEDAIAHAKIIHYVGKIDKPWVYSTANLQDLWQSEYDNSRWGDTLDLIEYVAPKATLLKRILTNLKEHGFGGTFCYLIYKIKCKFQ